MTVTPPTATLPRHQLHPKPPATLRPRTTPPPSNPPPPYSNHLRSVSNPLSHSWLVEINGGFGSNWLEILLGVRLGWTAFSWFNSVIGGGYSVVLGSMVGLFSLEGEGG